MHLSKKALKIRLRQIGSWTVATLTLLAPLSALTAQSGADLSPQCGGPFQLCSYVENGTEVERIPQQFEVARPFSEGLAAVRVEGLYGFIDTTGKLVITPRFQNAGPFSGEYAEIRLGDASGIIDRSGKLVISPQFRRIFPFTGDTFIAEPLRSEPWDSGFFDGRLASLSESFYSIKAAGLFHLQKGWLSEQKLQFSLFDKPERGLVWAGRRIGINENIWGLMRSDGTWQVTPRYDHVQQLSETHAIVEAMPGGASSPQQGQDAKRLGAVDRDGKLVVPLKFGGLSYWRGGYGIGRDATPFKSNGAPEQDREALVRADGTLLANRYFDNVDVPGDGKLPRGRIGKTWYSIEPNGRLIPDQLDGKTIVECPDGLTIIQRGEMVEFRRPKEAHPLGLFENRYFWKSDCPTGIAAQRNGKWFIVLEDGSVLGGKDGFENSYSFIEKHAAVQVEGKWGVIDRSGTFTVKPRFGQLRPYGEGIFIVDEGKDPYWIDAQGKHVEKPNKQEPPPDSALNCKGGLRFFEQAGLWGLQDSNKKTVIEPQFRALSCFEQGVTWAATPDGKAWCPIGSNGQRRDAMECRTLYYPTKEGLNFSPPEKFSNDPYESSVLWNRAWLDHRAGKRDQPPKWR